ncbi:uridine kinase family protein [Serinibacter arcticus]|uniref:uridine kinase family protein n=1 Tax=Serinibacter arcticus TaxID=1655435 RepID=UPI0018EECA13|nr:hypothetical protein [Serinibacter arcticus]
MGDLAPMRLEPGEPAAGAWRAVGVAALLDELLPSADVAAVGAGVGDGPTRTRVLAVDGRGGAGKSTLAARLAAVVPGAVVVHTDDLAWHEPFFAWGHLLEELLDAVARGDAVAFRPPAWEPRGRDGHVVVPARTPLVVVEGTGAALATRGGRADATIWVQVDAPEAERRGIARDVAEGANGDLAAATAFWHEWSAAERTFVDELRPWDLADVVVAGTPVLALDGDDLAVGRILLADERPGLPGPGDRGWVGRRRTP